MRKYQSITATIITVLILGAVNSGPAVARSFEGRCAVPKLSGVTLKAARTRLSRAHCRVGAIHRPSAASGVLVVARQSPHAGRRIKRESKVTIWLTAKSSATVPAPPTSSTSTTPTTTTGGGSGGPTVRASIDPSYTQDASDPLKVTWTYSAATAAGTLPDGVLSLTVYEHAEIADAGGCTMDVGGTVTGGACTLELPAYGAYDVTVTYDSSDPTVAPSTQTDTETIKDPSGTPPTWVPTTTTLTVGQVSVENRTGPPPTDLQSTTTTVPLDVATPSAPYSLEVTITDVTTGATMTGSWVNQNPDCNLQFGGPSSTTTLSGCGVASMPFAYTDVLDATVTSEAAFPYEASTSPTVEIWAGSLPPDAVVN